MGQFNLSLWLQNKSRKVVTRDGREAIIICTDADEQYPVVAKMKGWDCFFVELFDKNGRHKGEQEDTIFDLFFADEEEILTEFEKAIKLFVDNNEKRFKNGYVPTITDIKTWAEETLRLARKELLKDLPKWKKATEYKDLEKHIAILEENKVLLSNYLEEGDYYIELEDLKTLPKEE